MSTTLEQQLQKFIKHAESLNEKDDSDQNGYQLEYQILRDETLKDRQNSTYPAEEGRNDSNIRKNRYKDILPFDSTRVTLTLDPSVPGSDYINANFVKDVHGKPGYIAAQGPLPHTVTDFWRMLWEYEVEIVIMVCREIENAKPKCECYWPMKGETKEYSDIQITLESQTSVNNYYSIRCLKAIKDGEQRILTQFHYTGWLDHDIPADFGDIIELVTMVREKQTDVSIPIVVHCSAGCGRTGTICAIDYAWNMLKAGKMSDTFSLFDIIQCMRTQRQSMVQTPDQYMVVHLAIVRLFEEHLKIISNHNYVNMSFGNEDDEPVTEKDKAKKKTGCINVTVDQEVHRTNQDKGDTSQQANISAIASMYTKTDDRPVRIASNLKDPSVVDNTQLPVMLLKPKHRTGLPPKPGNLISPTKESHSLDKICGDSVGPVSSSPKVSPTSETSTQKSDDVLHSSTKFPEKVVRDKKHQKPSKLDLPLKLSLTKDIQTAVAVTRQNHNTNSPEKVSKPVYRSSTVAGVELDLKELTAKVQARKRLEDDDGFSPSPEYPKPFISVINVTKDQLMLSKINNIGNEKTRAKNTENSEKTKKMPVKKKPAPSAPKAEVNNNTNMYHVLLPTDSVNSNNDQAFLDADQNANTVRTKTSKLGLLKERRVGEREYESIDYNYISCDPPSSKMSSEKQSDIYSEVYACDTDTVKKLPKHVTHKHPISPGSKQRNPVHASILSDTVEYEAVNVAEYSYVDTTSRSPLQRYALECEQAARWKAGSTSSQTFEEQYSSRHQEYSTVERHRSESQTNDYYSSVYSGGPSHGSTPDDDIEAPAVPKKTKEAYMDEHIDGTGGKSATGTVFGKLGTKMKSAISALPGAKKNTEQDSTRASNEDSHKNVVIVRNDDISFANNKGSKRPKGPRGMPATWKQSM